MNARRRRVAGWSVLLVMAAAPGLVAPARAENYVTVRGAYYRETSTRVVQPVVEVSGDLPAGFDVAAQYLLDAITSASIAAGTSADSIFTEFRNEIGVRAGWTGDRERITLGYRYSAESDYWSHAFTGSGALRLWGDSATLAGTLSVSFDGAWPRNRTPQCPGDDELRCRLRTYYAGFSYTQVWFPTLVSQLTVEGAYLDGYQASLYRAVPNLGPEVLPLTRLRGAVTPRVAYYLPPSRTGFQLQYRYYRDDWGVGAHMVEGRIYQNLTRDLEVRASYRYYSQLPADFWCDWMANPGCYQGAKIYTADPKLQGLATSMPELKVVWDAVQLRGVPFLGWFAEGSFEISYARLIQNSVFGNAHLLQMGYTLPY